MAGVFNFTHTRARPETLYIPYRLCEVILVLGFFFFPDLDRVSVGLTYRV